MERQSNLEASSKRWLLWSSHLKRNNIIHESLLVNTRRIERHAATQIQRLFRGRFGRQRFTRLKVVHFRESIQARYNNADGVYKFYFEQNGAAIRIQHWFVPSYVTFDK